MLMRTILTYLLFFLPMTNISGQDYTQYHKAIIKAEEQIFIQNTIAEGLKTYREVFGKYDFVFVHDCMNAMQLALHAGDEKSFLVFTDKATKNGVRKHLLAKYGYITKHPLYIKNKDSIDVMYKKNRPVYLNRLDTVALVKVYELFALDQTVKNNRQGERPADRQRRYIKDITRTMEQFMKIANSKGFPGDRLIGVAQNNIMAELKNGRPDLVSYYYEYKDESNIGKGQFELAEYCLSSLGITMPIIVHYVNNMNGRHPFAEGYIMEQIKKGNLHPKDIALINDIRFDIAYDNERFRKPDLAAGDMYFRVCERLDDSGKESPTELDKEINKFRARYFIAPIEQDRAKRKFMKEHKMYYGWGWHGNRS